MRINLNNLVSMTEANQNFSRVTKLVDENGAVVILKNNMPRYVVIDYSELSGRGESKTETVEAVSRRILNKHIAAFEELAK